MVISLVATLLVAHAAPTADAVITSAMKQAAKGDKGIVVIFHASWCGWCHRLDDVLNQPKVKASLDKKFVITHLDGGEQADKKDLENAGWATYADKWEANNQGWPFMVFLNSKGKKVGDSRVGEKKQNFGFPTEPAEYDFLKAGMKAANPKFTDKEFGPLLDALKAAKPKQ
ncbi:MAG: thioredoxin family protein [Armatimonadetes bacterium]|nr:thioredoxin family protein [Armatimonadota bacterium]